MIASVRTPRFQRMALAHDLSLDHHDRGMPAALRKRFPPLGQPFPVVDLDRDAVEFVREGVADDVHRERTFPAGNVDLERPPPACPAVQGQLHGLRRHRASPVAVSGPAKVCLHTEERQSESRSSVSGIRTGFDGAANARPRQRPARRRLRARPHLRSCPYTGRMSGGRGRTAGGPRSRRVGARQRGRARPRAVSITRSRKVYRSAGASCSPATSSYASPSRASATMRS